ncbi:hypothetical protein FAI40_10215 [Acetobacteraceae bacterium]|nr:hypothetical protein FAI40_10215 [Acetobacteraceae bacterium]
MALKYENLTPEIRQLMLDELELDERNDVLFISRRLNDSGRENWGNLLRDAINNGDDKTLKDSIQHGSFLNLTEETSKGTRKVPATAAQTLADGEFNRLYIRALCVKVLRKSDSAVLVTYRARESSRPRQESENAIGMAYRAKMILDDLRSSQGKEPESEIPSPNSGISFKIA